MNNMINNRNNIPAYAKVSLEKLRCNNIGPKQLQQQPPFPTMFVPYQLQQPAWIYCHQDETQTYSVPGHPQMSTNKFGPPKPVSNLPGVGSSGYRVQPSQTSKCFHHPSTPQYQPPHLRRPLRLTSDSCEHLSCEDPWTPKAPLSNEKSFGQSVFPRFHAGSSEQLSERLMPPPENFDNSPSPVGEAVTRFDCDYSADSDQETSDKQLMSTSLSSIKISLKSNQCSLSHSDSSNFLDKSTNI